MAVAAAGTPSPPLPPPHPANKDDHTDDEEDCNLSFIRSPVDRKATLRQSSQHATGQAGAASGPGGGGGGGLNNGSGYDSDDNHTGLLRFARLPVFFRHPSSTSYEMFYDLWFVANLEVYNSSHGTYDTANLRAYLGFLTMLWMTWFLVGMFDVRFITDSIWERATRAIHLGVMVGFAVVGPDFDPHDQRRHAFTALSLIMMASRLVLVIQYLTVIWHIRRFAEGKWPVAAVAAFHLVAAAVYMGIAFRFTEGKNSRIYVAWYVVGLCEVLLNLTLSTVSDVLSFKGTHLTERMTVLTLIILGEGILSVAKNVSVIVQNSAWTLATVGVLIAAIATIYIFFQVYFDLMRNHRRIGGYRQLFWAVLHFPFHLALLLFMDGASNFLLVWKLNEVGEIVLNQFNNVTARITEASAGTTISTSFVINLLNNTMTDIWRTSQPTFAARAGIEEAFVLISETPDEMWRVDSTNPEDKARFEGLLEGIVAILLLNVVNSILVSFKFDPLLKTQGKGSSQEQLDGLQTVLNRFWLVFVYAYVCAGLVVMLTAVLFILARPRGWTLFHVIRTAAIFLLGFGLSLLSTLSLDGTRGEKFSSSAWLLPTLCLALFAVLVVVHLPSGIRWCCSAQRRQKSRLRNGPGAGWLGRPAAYSTVSSSPPDSGVAYMMSSFGSAHGGGAHWTAGGAMGRKEPMYHVVHDGGGGGIGGGSSSSLYGSQVAMMHTHGRQGQAYSSSYSSSYGR